MSTSPGALLQSHWVLKTPIPSVWEPLGRLEIAPGERTRERELFKAYTMLARKYLFPHVIEMNYQAGRRLGVNVYLIDGGSGVRAD